MRLGDLVPFELQQLLPEAERAIVSYGDILFRRHYLDELLASDADITIAVDALWRERRSDSDDWVRDFVSCDRAFSGDYLDDAPVFATAIGNAIDEADVAGEWIGLAQLSAEGAQRVRAEIEAMRADGTLQTASMLDLFQRLIGKGQAIRVVYVSGQWLDVDDAADILKAGEFL